MHSRSLAALLAMCAMLFPAIAHGGVYSDGLARCLVERSSDQDKILLAKWIFTVIAAHPGVTSLAVVDQQEKTEVAKGTGVLFETLLSKSCREETVKAVRYEGSDAIGSSFQTFGEIAMTTLLNNPAVQAETEGFVQYVDLAELEKLLAVPPASE